MIYVIFELFIEVVVVASMLLGCASVTYLNLNYKDEIWEDIYERMGWNEASIE